MTQICFIQSQTKQETQAELDAFISLLNSVSEELTTLLSLNKQYENEIRKLQDDLLSLDQKLPTSPSLRKHHENVVRLTKQYEDAIEEKRKRLQVLNEELPVLLLLKSQYEQVIRTHEAHLLTLNENDSCRNPEIVSNLPPQTISKSNHPATTRSPMKMLHSRYKGMKLGDIAADVMNEKGTALTTSELTQIIYDTRSEGEFERARNSLSSELRSEVKKTDARWRKVGRYAYITAFPSTSDLEVSK